MDYQIWLNGEYVDRDKATISMNDRGFKLGDVVFDTSRTFNGTVFRLRDHLVRLYRSLKYVRLDPGLSIAEMERLDISVGLAQVGAGVRGCGAHAVIPKTRAYSPESLDPKVKHYSRMNFVLAELGNL